MKFFQAERIPSLDCDSGFDDLTSIIRTKGLSKTYQLGDSEVRALREVTLDIAGGDFVTIMGPSGSGKSTLLTLFGLLDRPSSGLYWLSGQNVSDLDSDCQAQLRNQNIGFIFQSFNLLARSSAIENIELPLVYADLPKAERRERAAEALDIVGLTHRREHWPHQLSGGEQQRVAIARAVVNNPVLILADEPTGALDSRTGLVILELLKSLNQAGRTIVIVTHNPSIAKHANRILELRDGRLTAD